MSTSRERAAAYIWVTWLAPLLAGSNLCLWSVWFRAHYYHRRKSTFNGTEWRKEHDTLVARVRDDLEADGFRVTVEDDNRFVLTSNGISLAGRPDLVAVRPDKAVIVDCKSGSFHPAHPLQVQIYMVVLPCVHPELRGRDIEGIIQYPDDVITVPSSAVSEEFRRALRSMIHAVGGAEPPRKVPSAPECRFCPVDGCDCPDRVELADLVAVTDHGLF